MRYGIRGQDYTKDTSMHQVLVLLHWQVCMLTYVQAGHGG